MSLALARTRPFLVLLFSFAFVASPARPVEAMAECPETCNGAGDCDDLMACSGNTCPASDCVYTAGTCPNCDGVDGADYCVESVGLLDKLWSTSTTWVEMSAGYPGDDVCREGLIASVVAGASIKLDTDAALDEGQIIIDGEILASGPYKLSVPGGTVWMRGSGKYAADPDEAGGITARLSADSITLMSYGDDCNGVPEMLISKNMGVTTTVGDLVLDLNDDCFPPEGGAAALGGKTPPILRVANPTYVMRGGDVSAANPSGGLDIAGSFRLIDEAEVCVGCEEPGNGPPLPFVLHGDFDNGSTNPWIFNWIRGTLTFPPGNRDFEVGGASVGALFSGFSSSTTLPRGGILHTNFSMDHIDIAGGIHFENLIPNTVGTNLLDEALYVRRLTLRNSPTMTADAGVKVYYCECLDETGASIVPSESFLERIPEGCPEAPPPPAKIPSVSTWGVVILAVLLLCVGTVMVSHRFRRGVV